MIRLDNIPVTATFEQVVKRFRVVEEDDVALAGRILEQAKAVARPKALYKEVFVDSVDGADVVIDGLRFTGPALAAALGKAHRAFAYVCTCGAEVDDWSHAERDPVVAVWLDMIKQMFVMDAAAYLREHLKTGFGFTTLSSVNPGSGDLGNWPIAQQTVLFDLIGGADPVKEQIGVTLTDSFLMIPTKSMSGLLFPSETEFVNCALCGRVKCDGRRVPFDKDLYAKAFEK